MNIQKIFKENKITVLFYLCVFVVAGTLSVVGKKYYTSDKQLLRLQEEVLKTKKELAKQKEILQERRERQEDFIEKADRYLFLLEGITESQVSKLIEQVAGENEISLNSISEVKNLFKSADGCSILEFSISINGCTYENAMKFMAAIRNLRPIFNWQNIQITRNERSMEDKLFINGTLRVSAINNETIVHLLGDKMPDQTSILHKKNENVEKAESEKTEKNEDVEQDVLKENVEDNEDIEQDSLKEQEKKVEIKKEEQPQNIIQKELPLENAEIKNEESKLKNFSKEDK